MNPGDLYALMCAWVVGGMAGVAVAYLIAYLISLMY